MAWGDNPHKITITPRQIDNNTFTVTSLTHTHAQTHTVILLNSGNTYTQNLIFLPTKKGQGRLRFSFGCFFLAQESPLDISTHVCIHVCTYTHVFGTNVVVIAMSASGSGSESEFGSICKGHPECECMNGPHSILLSFSLFSVLPSNNPSPTLHSFTQTNEIFIQNV